MMAPSERRAQSSIRARRGPATIESRVESQEPAAAHPLSQQQTFGNRALLRNFGVSATRTAPVIQAKCHACESSDPLEQEADEIADAVVRGDDNEGAASPVSVPGPDAVGSGPPAEASSAAGEASTVSSEGLAEHSPQGTTPGMTAPRTGDNPSMRTADSPETTGGTQLIVEDSAEQLQQGQLRKTEYLAEVRAEVCVAAEEMLAPSGRSTRDCPYLQALFSFLANQSAQFIEEQLRRLAPGASGIRTARDYIPIITERVRSSTAIWLRTGRITGLPPDVPTSFIGPIMAANRLANAPGLLFKEKGGGAQIAGNPAAVRSELGAGTALESGVRTRMGSAMGYDFSAVRMHTDSKASELASAHNARAFTVGDHVAFGQGEYQPGTPVGDALIAHELAHVIQQQGAGGSLQAKANDAELEADADRAAVHAVVAAQTGAPEKLPSSVIPGLKTGLKLQRCPRETTAPAVKTVTINFTTLAGATDHTNADVTASNDIYRRAGCALRVATGASRPLTADETRGVVGADGLLEEPDGPTVSAEERSLVTFNRTDGRITAYYVPGFNPDKRGTSLQQPRHGAPDSLIMGPSAEVDTFTHELGHVLARDHNHFDSDPDNLMASGTIRNVGVDRITATQCESFRNTTAYPS